MPGQIRSAAGIVAALAMAIAPAAVIARPFTVADLLHQESFRASAVDPSERWFVFERAEPYDTAGRFDYDQQEASARTRLYKVDLLRPGPARPLLAAEAGAGL